MTVLMWLWQLVAQITEIHFAVNSLTKEMHNLSQRALSRMSGFSSINYCNYVMFSSSP